MSNKINVKAQAKPNQRVIKVISGDEVEYLAIGLGGSTPPSGGNADVMLSLYRCTQVGESTWSGCQVSWDGDSWQESDTVTDNLQCNGYTPVVGDVYTHDSTARAFLYPDQPTVEVIPTTATAGDILSGKTAVLNGELVTGTISTVTASKSANTVTVPVGYIKDEQTITVGTPVSATVYTPGTSDQIIAADSYTLGVQTIKGDSKLKPENIAQGVTIFGVTGIHASVSGGGGSNTGGADVSGVTATASDVLAGKYFVNRDSKLVEGTIRASYDSVTQNVVFISKGYVDKDHTVVVPVMADIVPTETEIVIPVGYNKEEQTFTIKYNIEVTEPDLSGVTVTTSDVLEGKKYVDSEGILQEGVIPSINALSFDESTHTVTAPRGYYASDTSYLVPAGSISDAGSEIRIKKGYITSDRTISLVYPNSSDATATADDIRLDKTAYVNNEKISGTIMDAMPQVTDNIVRIPPGYVGPEGLEKTLKTMDIQGPVDGVFTVPVGYNAAEFKIPINGVDTSSATAKASDIIEGKTAYVKAEKIVGSMPESTITYSNGLFTATAGYITSTRVREVPSAYSPYAEGPVVTTYSGYYPEEVQTSVKVANEPTKSGNTVIVHEGWNDPYIVNIDTMEPVVSGDTLTVPIGYNSKVHNYKLEGDLSPTTASAGDIIAGKTAFLNNELVTGTLAKASVRVDGAAVSVGVGYIDEAKRLPVKTATEPSVDKNVVTIYDGWNNATTRTIPMATTNISGGMLSISAGYFDGPYDYDLSGTGLDATATSGDIVQGKTAYVGGERITGSMPKANVKMDPDNGKFTVSAGYLKKGETKSIDKSSGVYLSADGTTAICGPGYLSKTSTYKIPSVSVIDDGDFIIVPAGYHARPTRVPKEELDTTDATAVAAQLAPGVTAYARGYKLTGSMPTSSARLIGTKVHITTGYTDIPYDVDIPKAPSPSVNLNTVTVYEGFQENEDTVTVGTFKGETTYIPTTEDQTIPADTYIGGTQTIKGDANLTADNIRAGYSIFGVTGSFTSDASAGADDIVEGTSAYVNGEKIDGTLPEQSAEAVSISVSDTTVQVTAPFGVYRSVRKSEPMSTYCDNPVYASSTIEVDVPDGAYKDGISKTYELSEPCECQDLKSYIVYDGGYLYGPMASVTNPEEAVEGDILATYELIQPTYGQEGGHVLNPDIGSTITVIKGEGSAIRYTAGGSDLSKSSVNATNFDYTSCTIQYDVTISGTSSNEDLYDMGAGAEPNGNNTSVSMVGVIKHTLGNLASISGDVQYATTTAIDPESGKAIIGSSYEYMCSEIELPDGAFDVECGIVTSNILGSDMIYGSDKFYRLSVRWIKGAESAPPNTKSPQCGPDDDSCTDPAYVGYPDSSDSYDPSDLMLVFSVPHVNDFTSTKPPVNSYNSYENYDTGNTRVTGFGAPWNWANYDNLTTSIEGYLYETKWTSTGSSSVGIRANAPRGTDLYSNYGIVLGSNTFSSSKYDSFVDERPVSMSSGHTSKTVTGTISISNPILIDSEGNEVVL